MADSPGPPAGQAGPPVFIRYAGATQTDLLRQQIGQVHRLPTGHKYHTGEQYISWLNYVFGEEGWSYRVLEHGRDEESDEVWVLVELSAVIWDGDPQEGGLAPRTVTKQDFGAQQVERVKSTGRPRSIGDSRKAAVTDGLKRCARQLGVALYLWEKEGDPADQPYRRSDDEEMARAGLARPGTSRAPQQAPATASQDVPGRPNGSNGSGGGPPPAAAPGLPRGRLEEVYADLLSQATADGFKASWTTTAIDRLTDVQLSKYADLLRAYQERRLRGAA